MDLKSAAMSGLSLSNICWGKWVVYYDAMSHDQEKTTCFWIIWVNHNLSYSEICPLPM